MDTRRVVLLDANLISDKNLAKFLCEIKFGTLEDRPSYDGASGEALSLMDILGPLFFLLLHEEARKVGAQGSSTISGSHFSSHLQV